MDEQQVNDHIDLMNRLLICQNEKEISDVLHVNSFLIDENFVRVVQAAAAIMVEKEVNIADFLLDFATQLSTAIEEFNHLNQEFNIIYQSGNYSKSSKLAEQALKVAQNIWGIKHPNVASSLNNLAVSYRFQGYYKKSEFLYKQALDARKQLFGEEHESVATSLNNLAELYRHQGRYLQAEDLYEKCLVIKKSICKQKYDSLIHGSIATTLNNLAALYSSQGRYSQAERLHQEALDIRRNLFGKNHPSVAASLNNLAEVYRFQGRYSESEQKHLEALEIIKNIRGDIHPNVANSLNNLAELYFSQGRYSEAESLHNNALTIRINIFGERNYETAQSFNNLAAIYRSQGRILDAEYLYLKVLEINQALHKKSHPSVATTLNNLAELYTYQKRYAEARNIYTEALEIRIKLLGDKHPHVATTLNNIALLYRIQGLYLDAEPFYIDSLATRTLTLGNEHPSVATSLSNYSILLVATNRCIEALSNRIRANKIHEKLIRNLFAFSSENDRLAYLQSIRRNLDTFLSLVFNHLSGSIQALQSALDLILKRKALTLSALAAQNEALYSDRYPHLTEDFNKLRDLSEQIIHLTFSTPQTEDFTTYQQQLAQLQGEHNSLQKNMASQVPEIQLQEQLPSYSDVASELPEGSILIEFVRFDIFNFKAILTQGEEQWQPARYLAFILPAGEPESVDMIDIGEAEYIDNLIREFRELVSGAGKNPESQLGMFSKHPPKLNFREYHPQAGIKLRQATFDKLRPALKEHKHLIIAPDGELNLVPFQILPSDDTGEKMLMDEFTISYLTVGRDILRQKIETKRLASINALVFASPNFDLSAENVNSDPAAKQNIQTDNLRECIANKPLEDAVGTNILGKRVAQKLKVASYLGNESLESYFKPLQCPRILLIATHGVFLPNQPEDRSLIVPDQRESSLGQRDRFFGRVENPMLRSALALAGANTWAKGGKLPPEAGKGILFAQDIAGLDLWANEITVLSACETAIGDVAIGEGVFGLRRAFAVAGAKTLIMSLWSVNGWTTAMLMERFFDNCEAGLGRATALQEAQNYVRNITIGELQQFELGQEILKHEFNNGRELDDTALVCQANDKPLEHPYYWGAWICQGDTKPVAIVEDSR